MWLFCANFVLPNWETQNEREVTTNATLYVTINVMISFIAKQSWGKITKMSFYSCSTKNSWTTCLVKLYSLWSQLHFNKFYFCVFCCLLDNFFSFIYLFRIINLYNIILQNFEAFLKYEQPAHECDNRLNRFVNAYYLLAIPMWRKLSYLFAVRQSEV